MMLLQKPRRSFWITPLKIGLIVAIVAVIWRLNIINATTLARIFSRPFAAVLSTLAIVAAIQLSVIRWHILLRIQGQVIPLGRLTSIVFTSYFLGSTTLGSLGVDGLRLFYIGRERPSSIGQAYLSIAADRLIGLFGLILAGSILFALNYREIMRHEQMRLMVLLSFSVGGVILIIIGLVGVFERFVAPLLQTIRPFTRVRLHFNLLVHAYRTSLGAVIVCLAVSVLVHFLMLASLLILAYAIFDSALSISQLGLAGVMATIANQIPITPGGLAIGEGLFAYLCHLMDPVHATSSYGSVVFLQRLVGLIAMVPGLFFFFIDRRATEIR
jgi:uncharacterized membrane protein YbhN (UPF0104 family)